MAIRFNRKWLFIAIIAVVIMQLVINGVFHLDKTRVEVEKFIGKSNLVIENIGVPSSYTLTKLTNVSKSVDQSAHSIYRFNVKGSTGNATITVKVISPNEESRQFKLISINK